ncbi:MAG: hypothetical protein R3B45_04745 [Bdellovibrionota bacterium]
MAGIVTLFWGCKSSQPRTARILTAEEDNSAIYEGKGRSWNYSYYEKMVQSGFALTNKEDYNTSELKSFAKKSKKLILNYLDRYNASVKNNEATSLSIAEARVKACMLNPAGKAGAIHQRWIYCHVPLEVRLCNSLALKKFKESDDRVSILSQVLPFCMKQIQAADGKNFWDLYDSVKSLKNQYKNYLEPLQVDKLDESDKEILFSDVPDKPADSEIKSYLNIIKYGDLVDALFPFGKANKPSEKISLVHMALYWVAFWHNVEVPTGDAVNKFGDDLINQAKADLKLSSNVTEWIKTIEDSDEVPPSCSTDSEEDISIMDCLMDDYQNFRRIRITKIVDRPAIYFTALLIY